MFAELTSEIIFYYPIETLLDRLKMYSQYQTRTADVDEENFITNDELDLVKIESDKAIGQIFQIAMKLSKRIVGSVLSDSTLTIGTETKTGLYGFRLVNFHGYNPNILPVIDSNIEKLWTALALSTWFTLNNKPDLSALHQNSVGFLRVSYNNSLNELYKPYIGSVTPNYSTVEVTVDDETNEVTTPTVTVVEMNDPLYFDTYSDFPETGAENLTYIDKSTGNQYLWSGTAYVKMNASVSTFSQEFEDVNEVVVTHNLNNLAPDVKMTDSDGNDWDVDYDPIDENSGTVSWENNKTGTIYLS